MLLFGYMQSHVSSRATTDNNSRITNDVFEVEMNTLKPLSTYCGNVTQALAEWRHLDAEQAAVRSFLLDTDKSYTDIDTCDVDEEELSEGQLLVELRRYGEARERLQTQRFKMEAVCVESERLLADVRARRLWLFDPRVEAELAELRASFARVQHRLEQRCAAATRILQQQQQQRAQWRYGKQTTQTDDTNDEAFLSANLSTLAARLAHLSRECHVHLTGMDGQPAAFRPFDPVAFFQAKLDDTCQIKYALEALVGESTQRRIMSLTMSNDETDAAAVADMFAGIQDLEVHACLSLITFLLEFFFTIC